MNNWNNLSDDELDKLFRQTADESNIEFEEGAWNKMEGLLNKNQPLTQNKYLKRNALVALALLFIVGTSLYFGGNYFFNKSENLSKAENEINTTEKSLNNNNENNAIETINKNEEKLNGEFQINETNNSENKTLKNLNFTLKDTEAIKKENSNKSFDEKFSHVKNNEVKIEAQKDLKPVLSSSNKTKENVSKKSLSSNSQNKAIVNTEDGNFESENLINKTSKTKNFEANKNQKLTSNQGIRSEEVIDKKNSTKSFGLNENKFEKSGIEKIGLTYSKNRIAKKSEIDKSETENPNLNYNSNLASNIEIAKNETQSIVLKSLTSKQINYKKPQYKLIVESLNVPFPKAKPEPFFKKGLSVRVGISPDISTVGSNSIHKIGSNMGGFLEYRFNKKVVLQAGIFRSMKYYDAYPEQYDWVWGPPPTKLLEIAAQCKMLDFPINFRYDFTQNSKSRLFGGLGITTYQMKEETYDYDYEDNSNPNIKWHQWNKKTGKYHFSSNLNISLGFEKQISRGLTMQVEPFAKAPLKSIGFGKVPLISYGMMFSANYPLRNLVKK